MPLPVVMTSAGPTPIPPGDIRNTLINSVLLTNPGYTYNLPGSLIEDISSTEIASIALCDQARIDLLNSIAPRTSNEFLLKQLGAQTGVIQGSQMNSSVTCNFTGTPGFILIAGFTVSDGAHQYIVKDGGIIPAGGSVALACMAKVYGTWPIPASSVTQLITSVPTGIALTVTNALPGTISTGTENIDDYRARVLQAGLSTSQGAITYLKSRIQALAGVQARLISVQIAGDAFKIVVGSDDAYNVAYAIFTALFDIGDLAGSTLSITGITAGSPTTLFCNQNHGYSNGQTINIAGATGTAATLLNGAHVATVGALPAFLKKFTIPVDTTGLAWTSGGAITPNVRNSPVTVNNYPDTYVITYVRALSQTVGVTIGWKTAPTILLDAAVSQLAAPAIINYINSLAIGYSINVYELQTVFLESIAAILPAQNISFIGDISNHALTDTASVAFTLDGVTVAPISTSGLIVGDPEGYFFTDSSHVTIQRLT